MVSSLAIRKQKTPYFVKSTTWKVAWLGRTFDAGYGTQVLIDSLDLEGIPLHIRGIQCKVQNSEFQLPGESPQLLKLVLGN
jgi:hypothetical protein